MGRWIHPKIVSMVSCIWSMMDPKKGAMIPVPLSQVPSRVTDTPPSVSTKDMSTLKHIISVRTWTESLSWVVEVSVSAACTLCHVSQNSNSGIGK